MAGSTDRFGDVFNPATGEITTRVALANCEDVSKAMTAAVEAFPNWAATPPVQRARVLFRFRDMVDKNIDGLAAIVTSEHGKVLSDARGSIQRSLEVVESACGIPHLLKGEYTEDVGSGIDSYSLRQPLGVCAGISPINFPAMVPIWMFPLSLACGNSFILKPSEKDPSMAQGYPQSRLYHASDEITLHVLS